MPGNYEFQINPPPFPDRILGRPPRYSALQDLREREQSHYNRGWNLSNLAQYLKLANPTWNIEDIYRQVRLKDLEKQLQDMNFAGEVQNNNFNIEQRKRLGIDPKLPYKNSGLEWWM